MRALSSLAPLKANAPGTCASLSVLCKPSLIASKLMSLLHLWWHRPDPYIPTSWKSGHLFLLPKPGKPPNSAKNLRPLALQEVFGKAVIGLVSERARASVLDILCSTPQLAYLPFRGTADAIARAVHHCQEVAHLITQFQRPAERQNSQLARTGLIGGALLSLDLSKAFDSVSRDLLFRGMEDLGVRRDCLHLLHEWHRGTHYDISHKGFSSAVPVHRGVRQGCKAAPFLWCCLTTSILSRLAEQTSWEWIEQCITIYADDFLVHQSCTTMESLSQFVHNCGILLDILEEYNLQINLQKCFSMVSLQGSAHKKAQARFLKRTEDGWYICFPRSNAAVSKVLLHSTVPYLGIKLSYKTLQPASVQHRLLSGLRAFQRLRPWLCSKKGLSPRQRDSLWCSVVRTTTLYGLPMIGCRPAGLRKLLSQLTLQRRMLMHDHSRDTHRTRAEFHEVFELEPPAVYLRRACLRILQGRHDKLDTLDHTDILHQIPLTETQKLVSLLDHWIVSQAIPVDPTVPAFQCRTCLARFSTAALLSRHEHHMHARGHGRLFFFRIERDALAGLPQCRHCDKTFQSWTNLRTHIEFGNCSQFDDSQADSMELDKIRTLAVPLIRGPSFQALGDNKELVNYMLTHCCVCGKQQSRFSDMVHHLQLEHGNLALISQRLYEEWAHHRSSPCELCQVQYRTSHQCKILLQAAVLSQWNRLTTEAPLPHAHQHPAEQDLERWSEIRR